MAKRDYLTPTEQTSVKMAKGQAFRIPRIKKDVSGHNCNLIYYKSPSLMRRLRDELGLVIHPEALELRLVHVRTYGNNPVLKQYPLWRIDGHDPLIISYVPSRVFMSTAWPLTMRHVDFDGEPAIEIGMVSPGRDFGQCQQVRATREWENDEQELVFLPGDGVVPNRAYWVQKMPARPDLSATLDTATINEREIAKVAWKNRRELNLRLKSGVPYESLKDKMQAIRKRVIKQSLKFLDLAEKAEAQGNHRDVAGLHGFDRDLK